MTFNRIQMLRNKPMKVAREINDLYINVQAPSIGEVYEDNKLFLLTQLLTMTEKELKEFLKITEANVTKLDMLTSLMYEETDKHDLFSKFKQIILGSHFKNNKIFVDEHPLKAIELDRIKNILQIAMGQKNEVIEEVEEELSEEEKRLKMLEEKVQAKKQKQKQELKENDIKENTIEDIMVSVIYEFGFSLEDIMNMNYFTLIWYYSYTGKLHVYRINQQAISSGMVKKINTDYFTSLK